MSLVQPSNSSPGSTHFDIPVPAAKYDILRRRSTILIALLLFLATTSNMFAVFARDRDNLTSGSLASSAPPCPVVSMPALSAVQNTVVTVPINTSDTTGLNIISFDTSISYDPSVITGVSIITTGTLSSSMTVTINSLTPGTILISAYTPNPVVGCRNAIKAKFHGDRAYRFEQPYYLQFIYLQ
jgi:hypothetical protein